MALKRTLEAFESLNPNEIIQVLEAKFIGGISELLNEGLIDIDVESTNEEQERSRIRLATIICRLYHKKYPDKGWNNVNLAQHDMARKVLDIFLHDPEFSQDVLKIRNKSRLNPPLLKFVSMFLEASTQEELYPPLKGKEMDIETYKEFYARRLAIDSSINEFEDAVEDQVEQNYLKDSEELRLKVVNAINALLEEGSNLNETV